jgi:hypothetical protein
MKKNFLLISLVLAYMGAIGFRSCKKSDEQPADPTPVITTSFTEEFKSVYDLVQNKYWYSAAGWYQGYVNGVTKAGTAIGFPAYSFDSSENEYAGSFPEGSNDLWLLTPPIQIKNGDTISFYTRADTSATNAERLQVRMNGSKSTDTHTGVQTIGSFTKLLIEINQAQLPNGYPVVWTLYQHVFSGINGTITSRIGFRHWIPPYVTTKGIGIDQFHFSKKQ